MSNRVLDRLKTILPCQLQSKRSDRSQSGFQRAAAFAHGALLWPRQSMHSGASGAVDAFWRFRRCFSEIPAPWQIMLGQTKDHGQSLRMRTPAPKVLDHGQGHAPGPGRHHEGSSNGQRPNVRAKGRGSGAAL